MKKFTIYAGKKTNGFIDDQTSISFKCDLSDTDTAYDNIAESIVLKDQGKDSQNLIDFQNCADGNVEIMLKDLVRMNFLSDFEEEVDD
ncbi:hypothetical protein DM298_04565 [Lactobacillus amylovorus]|uniref:Uncharacterized protein n=1 Tax=Lactobacillus amylovorus TaxID=1604 RepID=A0A5B8ED49_LACAM|nr:hypothetical protein [Lactobacillus amylovorus]QDD70232.1 hypothetical protein DM298_04565 [Lactobacillus amylovorus]